MPRQTYGFPVEHVLESNTETRARWMAGELRDEWAAAHPDLFDAQDIRPTRQPQHYFYEWLVAIYLKERYGLLSVVCKYGNHGKDKHPHKQAILAKCFDIATHEFLICSPRKLFGGRHGNGDWPDLFVYTREFEPHSFCEVKGEMTGDGPRPKQEALFHELFARTNIPITYAVVRGRTIQKRGANQSGRVNQSRQFEGVRNGFNAS